MITEREWRRQQAHRRRRCMACQGARYVLQTGSMQKWNRSKPLHGLMIAMAVVASLLTGTLCKPANTEIFADLQHEIPSKQAPRKVAEIGYLLSPQMETVLHTFTHEQLLRGSMLLINETHALPREAPAPNTASIALQGKGMVPVRTLHLQSGRNTIQALAELFADLRGQGVSGLMVWEGTLSRAQQRARQEEMVRKLMYSVAPDEAVRRTLEQLDWPGTGELQQEYTVELRFMKDEQQPDDVPLEKTAQGQKLLQTAWRYGFVRTHPQDRPAFRFRWVGKAHAMAMTYLDLTLEQYLNWLHEKGVLTIEENGEVRYVILCQPMTGSHIAFDLPEEAAYEASLDNMGYAIVACTLK